MDTRTLEQVIFDASSSYGMKSEHNTRSQAIAASVREWMKEIAREPGHGPSGGVQGIQAARIKELEAEVERLANLKSSPECCDKATKYDALRERFPFWPGEEFYAVDGNVISKHAVRAVYFDHVATQNGFPYGHNQCHPTADACRAAIPVEE